MRESGVNELCSQGERIILPKLIDVVEDALDIYKRGGRPCFLAIDIRGAFHTVPAGDDRKYTCGAFETENGKHVLAYDVLVFGSVSSPTLWGRFASWFGRTSISINPKVSLQTYADDPIFTFDESDLEHKTSIGISLRWAAVSGFPLKLEKCDAGSKVK